MKCVFIMGTAGSGKSTLVLSLVDRISDPEVSVATLNLDPGVRWLPYPPDVDIRDYVDYDRLAEAYRLGPNGALIASVDASVSHIGEIKGELEKLGADYVLVDTPGQMELFAYRSAGKAIASALSEGDFSTVFLADSIFLNRPSDFVSILLLSYSIQTRFQAPLVGCISKSDLLPAEVYEKAKLWITDPEYLRDDFFSERGGLDVEFSGRVLDALVEIGVLGEFIFTSSNTGEGLDDLYAQLQRIHSGGENQ
ncbi:MAG: ATP/GTP-binding protein [Candidatus Verstraetearchaeota archaeon]|nr:ATP/GTP-binding protein [Candidatus Verstraetearchaeota archaeon]